MVIISEMPLQIMTATPSEMLCRDVLNKITPVIINKTPGPITFQSVKLVDFFKQTFQNDSVIAEHTSNSNETRGLINFQFDMIANVSVSYGKTRRN